MSLVDLSLEERKALAELLSTRTLSPIQHHALDRCVNPPPEMQIEIAWIRTIMTAIADVLNTADDGIFEPTPLTSAISRLREIAYLSCPSCSEAGGAERSVKHMPPLCAATPRLTAKERRRAWWKKNGPKRDLMQLLEHSRLDDLACDACGTDSTVGCILDDGVNNR